MTTPSGAWERGGVAGRRENKIRSQPPEDVVIFKTKIVPKKNAHRAGLSRYGKLYQYRSKSAVDSEEALHWEAKGQCKDPMMLGRVQVVATFRKTRADCIGLLETVLDALQGVAYKDDRQVVRIFACWDENGMLEEGQAAGVILNEF